MSAIAFEHVLRVGLRQAIVVNDLSVGPAGQDTAARLQIPSAFERPADDRHDSAAAMIDAADLDRSADLCTNFERQLQLGGTRRTVVYRLKHSRSRL